MMQHLTPCNKNMHKKNAVTASLVQHLEASDALLIKTCLDNEEVIKILLNTSPTG